MAAWVIAAVATIALGSSLADDFRADYATPESESKAAQELTGREFAGFSGDQLFAVWRDPTGAWRGEARERIDAFLDEAKQVDYVGEETPVRVSDDGRIATTTLPLSASMSEIEREDGEHLIAAAERHSGDGLEIKLGGEPIVLAQEGASPESVGFLGAAIVLLIAFGSIVAAGLPVMIALVGLGVSSGGLILLLTNIIDVPDWSLAVAGLIGIGVGIDCTAGGKALLAGRDRWRESLLRSPLRAYTDRTITDPGAVEREAATTRERGYAIEEGEYRPGIRALAAPVHNGARATIAAIGVSTSGTLDVETVSDDVARAAATLSSALAMPALTAARPMSS